MARQGLHGAAVVEIAVVLAFQRMASLLPYTMECKPLGFPRYHGVMCCYPGNELQFQIWDNSQDITLKWKDRPSQGDPIMHRESSVYILCVYLFLCIPVCMLRSLTGPDTEASLCSPIFLLFRGWEN